LELPIGTNIAADLTLADLNMKISMFTADKKFQRQSSGVSEPLSPATSTAVPIDGLSPALSEDSVPEEYNFLFPASQLGSPGDDNDLTGRGMDRTLTMIFEEVDASSNADESLRKAAGVPENIRQSVLKECGFLRIEGSSYRPSTGYTKDEQAGSQGCLMFFISGLPWAKRAKWLVPLRWTVGQVLQFRGLHAEVVAGSLYLTDDDGVKVRVDFLPARRLRNDES
jgi:hypothetical protein